MSTNERHISLSLPHPSLQQVLRVRLHNIFTTDIVGRGYFIVYSLLYHAQPCVWPERY